MEKIYKNASFTNFPLRDLLVTKQLKIILEHIGIIKLPSSDNYILSVLLILLFFVQSTTLAAITQRGSSTNSTSTNTDITINKPTGVEQGDVMIVNISKIGNDTENPTLSGWTLIAGADLGGGTARRGSVLYKIAGASEPANYTFALGTGTNESIGAIVAFTGVDVSGPSPFDITPGSITVRNAANLLANSITTVSSNAAIIMFGMVGNDFVNFSAWNTTSPGTLTELYDNNFDGGNVSIGAAWNIKSVAGATGDGTATVSNTRNGSILIALKAYVPPAIEPTTQASNINFSSIIATGMTLNWTSGNGSNRIVLVKSGSAVDNAPVDGTSYTANTAFGSGTQIGSGNYVVYNGTGNSVAITGLSSSTTYYVAVYEFNGTGGGENYLITNAATGSQITNAANGDYRSNATTMNWNTTTSGQWQRHNGTSWQNTTTPPTNTNSTKIIISSGNTVTIMAGVTVDQVSIDAGGQVTLNTSGTLTIANGVGDDFVVNGTFLNTNGNITTTGNLVFKNLSTYQHGRDGSNIPTATWDANSTCLITGVTTTVPTVSSFAQSFGNFTWNCSSQNSNVSLAGELVDISGNFTMSNTGTSSLRLLNSGGGSTPITVNIGGNYIQTGGYLYLYGTTTQTGIGTTLNISGNFTISGGTLNHNGNTSSNSSGSVGTINLFGDFLMSSGTLTENGNYSGAFNFTSSGIKTFTKTGGTISNTINFEILSGATVDFGTSVLDGSGGRFALNLGAGIITANTGGLSTSGTTGSIQVSGTRTYNTGANYTYNGTSVQVTGDGLTGANSLTINNAAGVTLNRPVTLNALTIGSVTANTVFNDGGNQITSTGTFLLNQGTFKLGVATATAFPAFTLIEIKPGTTVEYASTAAQQVSAAPAYANLTFSGASIKTAQGAITVTENLTISAGTFAAGAFIHSVGKNWTNNGAFTAGTSTITFNGSSIQTIGGSSASTFNNLTLANIAGATMGRNATVSGSLALTNGALSIGNYTLALNGTITGTGTLTGGTGSILTIGGTSGGNLGTINFTGGTGTLNTLSINRDLGSAIIGSNLTVGTGGLTITRGVIEVSAGKSLTVNGTTSLDYTTSPCLVLKSIPSLTGGTTASFIDNGTITGSGTAKIERYLVKYDLVTDLKFHFLSSPVVDQPIESEFMVLSTPNTDFYKWDENQNYWVSYRDMNNTATRNANFVENNFVTGRGYLVAYPNNETKNFVGKPYTNSAGLNVACTNHPLAGKGFNLVGNPFPSAIDWNLIEKSGMDGALYFYNNNTAQYAYYVLLTGDNTTSLEASNGYIPAMQGFMVHASAANASITIANNDRVHQNMTLFYKSATLTENVLNLKVEGNNVSDAARVCFYDQATENFDGEFDAYKLFSYNANVPNLYSVTPDKTKVAINTLPLDQMYGSVPVGFTPGESGTYTITADGISNFPSTMYIKLEDKKTNSIQKLNDNPVYSFTASPGDDTTRFVLHFQDATSINKPEANNNFTLHVENGTITINQLESMTGKVKVSDMLGRSIAMENMVADTPLQINLNSTPGVYVVTVYTKSKTYSQKVVIR